VRFPLLRAAIRRAALGRRIKDCEMAQTFDRKIFTAKIFFSDLGFLIAHLPSIVGTMRDKALGKTFIEKTMMVVTGVNGCTYCTWFHANQAVKSGMSEQEVLDTFNLQFQAEADEHTLPALLFAQHYAETDRHPEPAMWQRVVDAYGETTAWHVMMAIRMIFFGNLLGNTFDAVFFLLTFWFMLPGKWQMDRQNRAKAAPKP
jgi:AhpD family alkylhydroperoxidase